MAVSPPKENAAVTHAVPSVSTITEKYLFLDTFIDHSALLQILLGIGIHINFSSQVKFAKIGFYGAFHL